MEELKSAMEAHLDQMADLVQKLSSELRSGLRPAIDNFIGFFHAIDWTEPWLMGLIGLHLVLLRGSIESWVTAGGALQARITLIRMEVFLSVVWSGPLLIIATIILINSLFSLVLHDCSVEKG
uniref:Transmembrane protein 18 n=1 Tax=Salix viminalis TaxID=40686 RepID=A0A6N2LT06_SALVM